MDKPDWSEAPEWAMWVAQDSPTDGSDWSWFECMPSPDSTGAWIQDKDTKWSRYFNGIPNNEWIETLEQRP